MNRDQKAAAIAEIASDIKDAQAVLAVDPTGLTVAQSAEIRGQLRNADATLRVVKNTLSQLAADEAGVAELKELLVGPTALTFVRGDAAAAAKAISDYARATDLLPFKGGYMDGAALDVAQIQAIAKLPSRDVLYGQLVGMIAAPITGLARGLNALLSGVAIALGQVQAKAESGEITLGGGAGEPAPEPQAEAAAAADEAPDETAEEPVAVAETAAAEEAPADEAPAETAEEPVAESAEEPVAESAEPADADQGAEAPAAAESSEEPAEAASDTTDNNEESE